MSMHMMDITTKAETRRSASAECCVRMQPSTMQLIRQGEIPKGDVVAVSQTAGVMAAKQTPDLLPLCHPLLPGSIDIEFDTVGSEDCVRIRATVTGIGRTGFEMEAMVAASVAALNLYDMCKNVDKGMIIEGIRLVSKTGGKSGTYTAGAEPGRDRVGEVIAVCLGKDKGPKNPVGEGVLQEGTGFLGDSHAGTERQVSLLAIETVERFTAALRQLNPRMMETQGIRIAPGDSAENLLIQGIDLLSLPLGTRLRVGAEAVIELVQLGKKFHKPGFFLLPLEGAFGSVVHGGTVRDGDAVQIIH